MTNQNVTLNTQQKSFAQALFNAYQGYVRIIGVNSK